MRGVPLRGRGETGFYRFMYTFVHLVIGVPFRLRVIGHDNVPKDGAVILAVTHKSTIDPMIAGVSFARNLRFMAKKELFSVFLIGRVIGALGSFPVDRGAGDRAALETGLNALNHGGALLMFPEGHRFKDDLIHPFLPGVGMLAMRTGATVIPVAIKGTRTLGRTWPPRLSAVTTRIGTPVDLSGLEGRRRVVYTAAAERIEAAVRALYDAP
jgi:1-acyl-sn-glycerol-3-phosphate acyltransferase